MQYISKRKSEEKSNGKDITSDFYGTGLTTHWITRITIISDSTEKLKGIKKERVLFLYENEIAF